MIKQLIILFYFLSGVLTPSISIALVIGSDQEEIYIDANFSGEELLVFGAFYSDPSQSRDSKSDILIEVVGPLEDVALRKKDSYFGFWLFRREKKEKREKRKSNYLLFWILVVLKRINAKKPCRRNAESSKTIEQLHEKQYVCLEGGDCGAV